MQRLLLLFFFTYNLLAMASSRVGFVGLGIMGKGMAQNLLKKMDGGQSSLVVWNRSPEVCAELSQAYPGRVTIAVSAADVVRSCEVTYSMLSTMEASEAVFDPADGGVISAMSSGKTLVDCATLSPARMMYIASEIEKRGGKFLEAPVSGSKVPAETGTLIFLCGGNAEVFSAVSPALECMGKASFHLGPVGAGSKMKLVVNMIMGTMMGAFAEGMALCDAADLPQEMLLQVINNTVPNSLNPRADLHALMSDRSWNLDPWPIPCSRERAQP